MPLTFFASLVFAMSISGVPPFNGFASKWMIYQGIIDFGTGSGVANKLWVIWLGLAVLGSALTLASFVKLIGGIFLSRRKPEFEMVREVPVMMGIPLILLSLLCIFFGVFGESTLRMAGPYIEGATEKTGCANLVTGVVFDFRGYDTLGEATVLVTAVLGVLTILRIKAVSYTHLTLP